MSSTAAFWIYGLSRNKFLMEADYKGSFLTSIVVLVDGLEPTNIVVSVSNDVNVNKVFFDGMTRLERGFSVMIILRLLKKVT